MNTNHWQGKRMVITGGSSGLGLALARQAYEHGAHVVVIARNKKRLQESVRGTDIYPIAADVSSKEDIYRIVGEATGHLGGVDILVNNASALGPTPMRPLLDTDCEALGEVMETNVIGPFRLTKALLASMLLQGAGVVVNISSDAARGHYPTWGPYGASKAALDHLTQIWQEELRAEGIRFFAIDPGDMHTPMHLAAIPDADPAQLYDPKDVAADLLAFLAREPADEAVRYSASEWRKS